MSTPDDTSHAEEDPRTVPRVGAPGAADVSVSATATLENGAVINEAYEIVRSLGKGGFGHVMLARNVKTGAHVAMKLVTSSRTRHRIELEGVRAFYEIKLHNPFLVDILHVAELQARDYSFYYTMPLADDFVRGTLNVPTTEYEPHTLAHHVKNGPLTITESLEIIDGLAVALGQMHKNGFVHCDVKPQNVLKFNQTWKLGDYSLLRRRGQSNPGDRGTPWYAPAEGTGDKPADVFALGRVLLNLCTGTIPTAGYDPYDALYSGALPIPQDDRADDVKRLIWSMCNENPTARPLVATIKQELIRLGIGKTVVLKDMTMSKDAIRALLGDHGIECTFE